jgi:MFS transporter, NNP family, nitrate/nitrite transporter
VTDRRARQPDRPVNDRTETGNATMLALATLAFFLCFYAWSLLGPLGPDLQDHLGLSDIQLSVAR